MTIKTNRGTAALTAEQERVLECIRTYKREHGMPPSLREICTILGYKSVNNGRQHLRLIEQKGFIRCLPGVARGIDILENDIVPAIENSPIPTNVRELPIIGSIAAGVPITAEENHEGTLTVDSDLFGKGTLFTLRVRGDSMKNIGVLNGDFVIVRQQDIAQDGDVVVAIIDGEATLKRFFRRPDCIVLHPENEAYHDIIVPPDQSLLIAGKMAGVVRCC